jgi:hypothetical protein
MRIIDLRSHIAEHCHFTRFWWVVAKDGKVHVPIIKFHRVVPANDAEGASFRSFAVGCRVACTTRCEVQGLEVQATSDKTRAIAIIAARMKGARSHLADKLLVESSYFPKPAC